MASTGFYDPYGKMQFSLPKLGQAPTFGTPASPFTAFGVTAPGGSPFGQPAVSGFNSGVGGAIRDAAGKVGGAMGGAVDWLTDEDRGLNRQLLLTNLIGMGGNLYGAYKQGKEEDRRRKQEEANAAARLPMYRSIIDRLMAEEG